MKNKNIINMNREIKFRAFNHVAKKMYLETKLGDVFKWHNEGQVQTIMQFTGLHDKNGKDIYEGDIVKNWQGGWNVVVYKSPSFEATVSEDQSSNYSKEWWGSVEIIGNIYENPELCNP